MIGICPVSRNGGRLVASSESGGCDLAQVAAVPASGVLSRAGGPSYQRNSVLLDVRVQVVKETRDVTFEDTADQQVR